MFLSLLKHVKMQKNEYLLKCLVFLLRSCAKFRLQLFRTIINNIYQFNIVYICYNNLLFIYIIFIYYYIIVLYYIEKTFLNSVYLPYIERFLFVCTFVHLSIKIAQI